jgi:hypothetical protein
VPSILSQKQVQEIQRHLAKSMWGLMLPGGATSYDLAWPALKNFGVYRVKQGASPVWNAYRLWIDNTLPPA